MITFVILLLATLLIYVSCEYFVNAIEWLGRKMGVAHSAVGTVLAAVGTALPESIVTFTAVALGFSDSQKDIGVGAALGGPLLLSTVGYAVVGLTIFVATKRSSNKPLQIDRKKLGNDQLWFLGIFAFNTVLGAVILPEKIYLAFLLIAVYIYYGHKEVCAECISTQENLEPLKLQPHQAEPDTFRVVAQISGALLFIFIGSQLFVHNLESLGQLLNVPSQLIALFFSPLATELPEILNAIIWVKQGKVSLALANISGSMMIQATVPSALGIYFTSWQFDPYLFLAVAVTMMSVLFLHYALTHHTFSAKKLSFSAAFYILFLLGVLSLRNGLVDVNSFI